ncbi:RNA-binding S4 domain-containing protein [Aeromicrobium phragmitis]|uniref:RNA-binding S4 domain-containing protein n=1 Tax=Aeromicrobium phragmitis TaxID=2478914 RepID=A0A3L8PL71_9ACTN|nr:RNA-binding S4 domain-containing protein [Aeromicrobium phragmitis]RLV55529.1 RNA-binding S4 domain-containing protein [Aeromicrobium phragmitis]
MPEDIEDVVISSDVIRLGQLLKYVGVAESGAQAGSLIAAGDVRVNGDVETRRGRQLVRGDVIEVAVPSGASRLRIA